MNALVKAESKEVAVADRNPFTEFATAVSPKHIFGTLLKFSKGDWLYGESNSVIPPGAEVIAIMDKMACGWIRWENSRPTDQIMVEVSTGAKPPRRGELGDTDKELWELDDKGQPKDPWQFTIYLPLISKKSGEVYTFSTSSKGGINAVGSVAGDYGTYVVRHPNEYPVLKLNVNRYQHQNKQYGVIKVPEFGRVGYVNKKDVAGALAALGINGGKHDGVNGNYDEANPPPTDDFSDDVPF